MKQTFTVVGLLLSQLIFAWGPMGHHIVAEVAYHYLSPEACADVDEVLGTHGMVYWATFPDEVRNDGNLYAHSSDWHYQDLPAALNEDQLKVLRTNYPTHGGKLWATLDQLLVQLPQHPDTLLVNSIKMPYHDGLVYLVHLTADELCPLHMAREEDQGGNATKVNWFETPANLHKVWDEKLIQSRGYSYTEYAQMLIDMYGNEVDSISNMTEMDFINYLYKTTQEIYTYHSQNEMNAYTYSWHWKDVCDRLLFMAGVRLANNIADIR